MYTICKTVFKIRLCAKINMIRVHNKKEVTQRLHFNTLNI